MPGTWGTPPTATGRAKVTHGPGMGWGCPLPLWTEFETHLLSMLGRGECTGTWANKCSGTWVPPQPRSVPKALRPALWEWLWSCHVPTTMERRVALHQCCGHRHTATLLPSYCLAEETCPGTTPLCTAHLPSYVMWRKFAPAACNNCEKSNLRFGGFNGAWNFLKEILQHCTGATALQINKDNSNKGTWDSVFLEHMKRLQNMPVKCMKRGRQAGWCDYNFPTEYTAASRLCSKEEIQLAFLLVHILSITAVAWQTTEHGAGGGWGEVSSVTAYFFPKFMYHLSSITTQDPFIKKTDKMSLEKRSRLEGMAFL